MTSTLGQLEVADNEAAAAAGDDKDRPGQGGEGSNAGQSEAISATEEGPTGYEAPDENDEMAKHVDSMPLKKARAPRLLPFEVPQMGSFWLHDDRSGPGGQEEGPSASERVEEEVREDPSVGPAPRNNDALVGSPEGRWRHDRFEALERGEEFPERDRSAGPPGRRRGAGRRRAGRGRGRTSVTAPDADGHADRVRARSIGVQRGQRGGRSSTSPRVVVVPRPGRGSETGRKVGEQGTVASSTADSAGHSSFNNGQICGADSNGDQAENPRPGSRGSRLSAEAPGFRPSSAMSASSAGRPPSPGYVPEPAPTASTAYAPAYTAYHSVDPAYGALYAGPGFVATDPSYLAAAGAGYPPHLGGYVPTVTPFGPQVYGAPRPSLPAPVRRPIPITAPDDGSASPSEESHLLPQRPQQHGRRFSAAVREHA